MGRERLVEVELHSTEPSAVEATRSTIRMLHPAGSHDLIEKDGRYYIHDGFCAFACERQGYVKMVLRPAPDRKEG